MLTLVFFPFTYILLQNHADFRFRIKYAELSQAKCCLHLQCCFLTEQHYRHRLHVYALQVKVLYSMLFGQGISPHARDCPQTMYFLTVVETKDENLDFLTLKEGGLIILRKTLLKEGSTYF